MKFWARSEKHGKQWETIFEHVDPFVRAFAMQHDMEITPWPWDAPEEILTWSSKGVHKNLRLHIEEDPRPYAVKLSGSAWVDATFGERRDRLAYYKQFEPAEGILIAEPTKALEAGPKVRDILEGAFKAVEAWDIDFLRKEGKRITLDPWPRKT